MNCWRACRAGSARGGPWVSVLCRPWPTAPCRWSSTPRLGPIRSPRTSTMSSISSSRAPATLYAARSARASHRTPCYLCRRVKFIGLKTSRPTLQAGSSFGGRRGASREVCPHGSNALIRTKATKSVGVQQLILDDLPAIAFLFDQYRQFLGRPADLKGCQQFLRARIDRGESVLFLARVAGHGMGFAQLYPIYSSVSLEHVFVLNDLFFSDAGRRQGLATALLEAAPSYGLSMCACSLRLHVAHGNLQAQALGYLTTT